MPPKKIKCSLKEPRSFEDAKKFLGTKFSRWWGTVDGVEYNDWFEAEITGVEQSLEELLEDGTTQELVSDEVWLELTYPAQKGFAECKEDLEWSTVFNSKKFPTHLTTLPAAAKQIVDQQKLGTLGTSCNGTPPTTGKPLSASKNKKQKTLQNQKQQRQQVQIKDEPMSVQPKAQPMKSGGRLGSLSTGGVVAVNAGGIPSLRGIGLMGCALGVTEISGQNKRKAVTQQQADDDNEDEDDSDDGNEQQQQQQRQMTENVEFANGVGDVDNEHNEEEEQRPQVLKRNNKSQSGGQRKKQRVQTSTVPQFNSARFVMPVGAKQGSAGQVYKIKLENFMCHQNFEITFQPHVNVITGPNGSGKSAILQALQCCLGVKLDRVKIARDVVRHGQHSAKASVTLWNVGRDAYIPELYGPQITIQRTISGNSSTYVMRDANGEKRASKKEDVDKLLDYLSINARNPAIVLTQDTARAFASTAGEDKKYKVFLEATHFEEIVANLKQSANSLAELDDDLEKKIKAVNEAQARFDEVKQQEQALREVDTWQRDLEILTYCLAWQIVYTYEKEIQKLEQTVSSDIPTRCNVAQAHVDSFTGRVESLQQRLSEERNKLEEVTPQIAGCLAETSTIQEEIKSQTQRQRVEKRALRELESEIDYLNQERQAIQDSADAATAQILQATQAQIDDYQKKVTSADVKSAQALQQLQQANIQKRQIDSLVTTSRDALYQAQRQENDAKNRVQSAQHHLHSLQRSTTNNVARFGGLAAEKLHFLVQQALQQNQFHRPPIGPIGTYLSLKDDAWGKAAEGAVGKMFENWIVHDRHDQEVLRRLSLDALRAVNGNTGGSNFSYFWNNNNNRSNTSKPWFWTFVHNYDTPEYNVSGRLPPVTQGRVLLLNVLKFGGSADFAKVVKNVMVDQAKIEKILLVGNELDARHVLNNDTLWRDYGLNACWSQNLWNVSVRGRTKITNPPRGYNTFARLAKDTTLLLGAAREEYDRALAQQVSAANERAERAAALAQVQQQQAIAYEQLRLAGLQVQESQFEKEFVQTQAPDEVALAREVQEESDNALTASVRAISENLVRKEREKAIKSSQLDELTAALNVLSRRLNDVRKRPMELTAQIEQIKDNIQSINELLASERTSLQEAERQLAELKQAQVLATTNLQSRRQQFSELLRKAEQVCSRQDEARLRAAYKQQREALGKEIDDEFFEQGSLEHEMTQLNRRIEKRQRMAGATLLDVERQLFQLQQKLTHLEKNCDETEEIYKIFSKAYYNRMKKYRQTRITVADNINKRFASYMNRRKHLGSIDVDWKTKKLSIAVGINGGEKTSDLKALSGGERSITTLAFVLSLAHDSYPPFQALDEFDIFTDSINRLHSLVYLMEFAIQNQERQLILLTPQDMNAVTEAMHNLKNNKRLGYDVDEVEHFMNAVMMQPPRGGAGSRRDPRRAAGLLS